MMLEIRKATTEDIPAIKAIADKNKTAIGFVTRPALEESVKRQQLYVAFLDGQLAGFCNLWLRRDGWATVQEICVANSYRGQGIGKTLLKAVDRPIRLKCPVDNESNEFYRALGFELTATLPGKKRQLNEWKLNKCSLF